MDLPEPGPPSAVVVRDLIAVGAALLAVREYFKLKARAAVE